MENQEKTREELLIEVNKLQEENKKLKLQQEQSKKIWKECEEKYEQVSKHTPAAIYEIDFVNQRFVIVNDVMCEKTGYSRKELLSMNPFDILSEESKKHFKERLKGHFAGKEISELTEFCIINKAGQEVWTAIHAKYIYKNDKRVGAAVVAVDITGRRKMEEELRNSNKKYVELFENANDIIFTTDFKGNFTSVNAAAVEVYGYTKKEFLQLNIKQVIDSRYDFKRKVLSNSQSLPQVLTYTKNGQHIWVEINMRLVKHGEKLVGLQGIARNITERKQAKKALEQSESMYRTIFENTGTATTISNGDTTFFLVNSEFEKLSGYTKKELQKKKSWTQFIYNKKDLNKLKRNHYCRMLNPDRSPGYYEFKFVDREENIKDVMMIVAAIPGTSKHVASFLDLTERKQFQKEISRLEKLNLVGQMASGMAHEIRNPMTTVRGMLQIFKQKEECIPYKKKFNLMIEEMDRADYIINQTLSLAKDKPENKLYHNLNTIIETIYPLLNSSAAAACKNINLKLGEIPGLLLDENEMRQLIFNLASNGLESMSPGGDLIISTGLHNNAVLLSVEDQGEGISKDIIRKIGIPFFTTKENGTGLGLAICHGIAARHNAVIDIETGSWGTKFNVWFKI
ncbi:MAG: PAS domain S-box protein [Clostridiales bacterium]|nr:PAS domain S-box protein [Clostridiales bacterium]MCF8023618.1 PAS domain S-box protein [Clostridiales bacterium]